MADPNTIISRAKSLAGLTSSWGSYWTGNQEDIAWGQAPAPEFPTAVITPPEFAGGFPEVPFSLPAIPAAPATNMGLQAATYKGTAAVLSLTPSAVLSALTYGTPNGPEELPQATIPGAPVDYPLEALLTLPSSAGLSAPALGEITVGDRPDVFYEAVSAYILRTLTPMDADIPDPEGLPDPVTLVPEDPADYAADAPLIAELLAALGPQEASDDDPAIVDVLKLWKGDSVPARWKHARLEDAAFNEAASKGFFAPTPMLVDAIINASAELRAALVDASNKARDEANKRFLDTAELSSRLLPKLEMAHFKAYSAYVERCLKALDFNVRMAQTLLKAAIDQYNIRIKAVKAVLADYTDYLKAVQRQSRTALMWFEGHAQNLEAYSDAADSYTAQLETAASVAKLNSIGIELAALPMKEFAAKLMGLKANLQINRQNVEAFGEAVRAFEAGAKAEQQAWAAYADGVQVEASATEVHSANLRALQGYYGAEADRAQAFSSGVSALVDATSQGLSEYNEYSQAQREYIQGVSAILAADSDRLNALLEGLRISVTYTGAWNQAITAQADARNMMAVGNADLLTRQATLRAQAAAAQAQIDAGWKAAQASAAASQAQALLGVSGTTIGIQGGASVSHSTSDTSSTSFGASASRGWSKTREYSSE